MPDPVPFISVEEFVAWFGTITAAQSALVEPYLEVVSGWIRDNKPDVSGDDLAAHLVVFEVARDALLYGDVGPLIEFSKTTGPRSKSGTLDRALIEKFITDRHRRMLGLALRAAPRGNFTRCDY